MGKMADFHEIGRKWSKKCVKKWTIFVDFDGLRVNDLRSQFLGHWETLKNPENHEKR